MNDLTIFNINDEPNASTTFHNLDQFIGGMGFHVFEKQAIIDYFSVKWELTWRERERIKNRIDRLWDYRPSDNLYQMILEIVREGRNMFTHDISKNKISGNILIIENVDRSVRYMHIKPIEKITT